MIVNRLADITQSLFCNFLPNGCSIRLDTEIQLSFLMFIQNRTDGDDTLLQFASGFLKFKRFRFPAKIHTVSPPPPIIIVLMYKIHSTFNHRQLDEMRHSLHEKAPLVYYI